MLSLVNDFFEICKIKIELEFINKIKHFDKYEKLKNALKKNFSEYLMNFNLDGVKNEAANCEKLLCDNIEKQSIANLGAYALKEENAEILKYLNGRIYFNKFFELTDIKNRYEFKKSSSDYEIKLFLNFFEDEKWEKIVSTYKQFKETSNEKCEKQLSYLILATDDINAKSKNFLIDDLSNSSSPLSAITADTAAKNESNSTQAEKPFLSADIIILEAQRNSDFKEDAFKTKFEILLKNIIFNLYKLFEKDLNSSGSYKEEEIEAFKKSKNFLPLNSTAERTIVFSSFKISYTNFNALFEAAKYNSDNLHCAKAKEGIACAFVLYDLFKTYKKDLKKFVTKELIFSEEIEAMLSDSLAYYKKSKIPEMYIDALFKFVFYYMFFESKLRSLLEYEKKICEELTSFNNPEYRLYCYLKLKYVFDYIKFRRKSVFYVYMCLQTCNDNGAYLNLVPYLLKEIAEKFAVNNIYEDKIENLEQFNQNHKGIIKSKHKEIAYYTSPKFLENEFSEKNIGNYSKSFCFMYNTDLIPINFSENNRKRIDKENKLIIVQRGSLLKRYNLTRKWGPIQNNILKNFVSLYEKMKNPKMQIAYGLTSLQILSDFLSASDQQKLMDAITKSSSFLQEKIFLNLSKLPHLLRIVPISSDIKFDSKKNPNYKPPKHTDEKLNSAKLPNGTSEIDIPENKIFLYNPWEKSDGINYYWTCNSYQKIYVEFYNPLSIEIKVSKIIVLFEGKKPFTFPISTFIPAKGIQGVYCKIRPLEVGLTNILGVKYEIFNTVGVQFADANGNGLFYSYNNVYKDLTNFSKTEPINLKNIKIYPEIPQISISNASRAKILSENLNIFENESKTFEFLLENMGNWPIHNITVSLYAYKREDYKIILDEVKLKKEDLEHLNSNLNNAENGEFMLNKNSVCPFSYDYLHKKSYKKLEFKVSFYSNCIELNENPNILKPYVLYFFNLQTQKLVSLSNLKVIPVLSNNNIQEIILNDKRINYNFQKCYCTENHFVNFAIGNNNEDSINFEIFSGEALLKQEVCEQKNSKEISLLINSQVNLSEFFLNWKFQNSKLRGKIDLSQILKEFQYRFRNDIKFEINQTLTEDEGINSFDIEYKVTNHCKQTLSDLKLYVYLYQIHEEAILFNGMLPENVFYEGSLYHEIDKLIPEGSVSFHVDLMASLSEEIFSTCLLVDAENRIVYLSPVTANCYNED